MFSKERCKYTAKEAVRNYRTKQLTELAVNKSTMERCHLPGLQIGRTHPVCGSVQSNKTGCYACYCEGVYTDRDVSAAVSQEVQH